MTSTPAVAHARNGPRTISFESLEETRLSANEAATFAKHARHEVSIALGRSTIAVRFSRPSAAAAFGERFGDMLGQRAADAVVYAVALDGQAYFWRTPGRARRWPENPSDDMFVFFADNVAMHEHFATATDVCIHAAVLARAAGTVALVGRSTAGKTTTALAAARHGFTLYSDERCILQDGHVVPFLRAITVREGGRAALLESPAAAHPLDDRLRELPARGDVAVRPRILLGERAGGPPRPLGAVFIIAGRDATPSVEACAAYAVLPELLRSMTSRDSGIDRAARLLPMLRGVPVYRLRLGTPAATAILIERTLDEANACSER
jgi:hypothetical protein